MSRIRPIAGLVCTLAMTALAFAAEPVVIQPAKAELTLETRTVPLASGSTLKVKNVNGHVHLQPWDKEQLEFRGEFKPSSKNEHVKVVIESTSTGLEIRGEYPKHEQHSGSYRGPECRMDLKVPRKLIPSLSTVNGEVEISGILGEVHCETVNGAIRASHLDQALKAETVNGSIAVDQVKGGLELKTVNGSITGKGLDGRGKGIEAETVNGAIKLQLDGIKGHLKASTVNGAFSFKAKGADQVDIQKHRITAVFPGGDQVIHLGTVNGSITLE